MKRFLSMATIFMAFVGYSQDSAPVYFKKNEISLNASSLLYQGLEVTYERGIQREIGVGVSSLLFVYQKIENEGQNFHITPYARYYFGKKPLGGFFVEGFTSLFNKNYWFDKHTYVNDYYTKRETITKTTTTVAFGFGLGAKWQTRQGLTFEIHGAIGREPRASNDNYQPFMGRGGLLIGYKF